MRPRRRGGMPGSPWLPSISTSTSKPTTTSHRTLSWLPARVGSAQVCASLGWPQHRSSSLRCGRCVLTPPFARRCPRAADPDRKTLGKQGLTTPPGSGMPLCVPRHPEAGRCRYRSRRESPGPIAASALPTLRRTAGSPASTGGRGTWLARPLLALRRLRNLVRDPRRRLGSLRVGRRGYVPIAAVVELLGHSVDRAAHDEDVAFESALGRALVAFQS